MKMTVQQYVAFWDFIGDDWYIEADQRLPEELPSSNKVIDVMGSLFWHGSGDPFETQGREAFSAEELNDLGADFEVVFARWRKLVDESCMLSVRCKPEQEAEVRKAITKAGGVIVELDVAKA